MLNSLYFKLIQEKKFMDQLVHTRGQLNFFFCTEYEEVILGGFFKDIPTYQPIYGALRAFTEDFSRMNGVKLSLEWL